MPKNYKETDRCGHLECSAVDHYIAGRMDVVAWLGSNGVYIGRRDKNGYIVGNDLKAELVLTTKEFHELLEDDDFILRVLLELEGT